MKCQKCKQDFIEREIQEHHIHPRFMDNQKGLGKKIYLCKKCHNILHLIIPSIIWKNLNSESKQVHIDAVISFTEGWIK